MELVEHFGLVLPTFRLVVASFAFGAHQAQRPVELRQVVPDGRPHLALELSTETPKAPPGELSAPENRTTANVADGVTLAIQ